MGTAESGRGRDGENGGVAVSSQELVRVVQVLLSRADRDGLARGEGSLLESITNGVVQTMKHHLGKGPTKAKTYLLDSHLFVVMQDSLTRAEESLLAAGQAELVRRGRELLHQHLAESYRAQIESATGRRVRSSQSQLVFDPDTEIQIFILES
jgi:uncharacterized protein YbcI